MKDLLLPGVFVLGNETLSSRIDPRLFTKMVVVAEADELRSAAKSAPVAPAKQIFVI